MGMIFLNGKEYTSSPKDGFPPIIYSDEEREIGVWRDGKPLYQKTLIVPKNIGTGNNVQYAHNIPNIDRVVGFEYGGMLSNGGIYRITYDANYRIWVHEINRTMVLWALGASIIQYLDSLFVTIQYTKTTDVAGSGKYTTYGGLTHHYSTNEQVVGTWTDGKPLYEKTIWKSGVSAGTEQNLITISDVTQNIGLMVEYGVSFYDSDKAVCINAGYYENSNYCAYARFTNSAGFRTYIKWGSSSFSYLKVICRYTKTTD